MVDLDIMICNTSYATTFTPVNFFYSVVNIFKKFTNLNFRAWAFFKIVKAVSCILTIFLDIHFKPNI